MKILSGSTVVVAVLATMIGAAEAATAGHMLRSSTPASAEANQDVTGSVKKPSEVDGDITGSIKKPHHKDPHSAGGVNAKPATSH